ncbi:MAG: hypothetical protein RL130_373, partial [Actinomycetota bacterium]
LNPDCALAFEIDVKSKVHIGGGKENLSLGNFVEIVQGW